MEWEVATTVGILAKNPPCREAARIAVRKCSGPFRERDDTQKMSYSRLARGAADRSAGRRGGEAISAGAIFEEQA
jgi:hypothetical protein